MRYQIVECEPKHVVSISSRLRPGDLAEVRASGLSVRSALWRSYRGSHLRYAGIIDGVVGAIWGCGGTILADIGIPWLLTSLDVEKIPMAFVREGRRHVQQMLDVHPVLVNMVAKDYKQAIGFLRLLGFQIGSDEVMPGFLPFRMEK